MSRKNNQGLGQATSDNNGENEKKPEEQVSDNEEKEMSAVAEPDSIQDPSSSYFLTEVTKDQDDNMVDNTVEMPLPVQSMSQPSLHILTQRELINAVQAKHLKFRNLGSCKLHLKSRHMSIA